jgi:hypothetical protein
VLSVEEKTMPIFTLFVRGLGRGCRQRPLAARLWVVNFLFALLVAAPAAFLLHGQISHSLAAASILKKLDVHWLTDLSTRYLDAAPAVMALLLAAISLYLLLSVFLNGGVIGGLNRDDDASTLADFFRDCGAYFWRFLRLLLLSLPVYLLALALLYRPLAALLDVLDRRAATEWPALALANLRILALVLMLGLVSMFFDYVKIGLVTGGRGKVLKEAWQTLKFLKRLFFRAWGLYLLAGTAFIALTLAYLEIARLLPQGRPAAVLLVFLWQQVYVLGRQASKVLFFATEIELAKQHQEPAR